MRDHAERWDIVPDPPLISVLRRRLRAVPPLQADGALTALITVAQLWPLLSSESWTGVPYSWWGYAVAVASSLPLIWRRRFPLPVLLLSLSISAMYDLSEQVADQPVWYGSLVGFYTVAAYSTFWTRIITLVLTAAGMTAFVGSSETALRSAVLLVASYAIGRAAATSRAHAAALEERATRLERERQMEAERAAERERARIARDMHDILAHAVSLMVVQAEAGPVAVRNDPERAEAAFEAIAGAGRDAMIQLRRMLGTPNADGAPRAPQPTVEDLPELAAQVAETGLKVAFHTVGEARPVTPDCAVAAYRITQEALTNIVKHAGARHADIRLTWEDDTLMIDITDDGQGSGLALPSSGHGLIGVRERAAACGGTATAGPRPDAPGFQVSVRLPAARS
jgi:signal transduction histidine kinase